MGREKFTEFLDKCEEIRKDSHHSELMVYETRGYGRSHLLAALVCYLEASGMVKNGDWYSERALSTSPVPWAITASR